MPSTFRPSPTRARLGGALLLLTLSIVTPAEVPAEESSPPPPPSFGPLDALIGRCWIGTFENGTRDLHCWDLVLQGRFVRDRHRLLGSETPYEGETFYAPVAPEEGNDAVLRFWYFTTRGGVSEGRVQPDGARWLFTESYEEAGAHAEMRTFADVPPEVGPDEYHVSTEVLRDGTWVEAARVSYRALGDPEPARGGAWGEQWDLVFNSTASGSYDVATLDPRTGEITTTVEGAGTEWVFAARDDTVALVSDRAVRGEGGSRLYRWSRARGLEPWTGFPAADSTVGLLPDGGAVVCAPIDGDRELLRIDREGTVVARLTVNEADDCQPDVTPNGSTVVFWSDRSGSAELWSMPLDGASPARLLTDFPANDAVSRHRYGGEGPARISPDGSRIAWMSIRDGEDWDVYTMAIDGSDVRRLTDHLANDAYPSWSPDGRWIAFDSDRFGSIDLFVVSAEGGRPVRLTDLPGSEQAPQWIPRSP